MSRTYSALQMVEMEKQKKLNGKPSLTIIDERRASEGRTSAEQESDLKRPDVRTGNPELPSDFREKTPPDGQNTRPRAVFLMEFVNHIKDTLGSIRNLTELSQGKFKDPEFGNNFYRMVTRGIDKTDSELDCFLEYVKIKSPAQKANTVHSLLEALLSDHDKKLKDRKIRIARKHYEKDLPETSVQDEELKYVLNWVLQYAILSTPPGGNIGILTKALETQEAGEDLQTWVQKEAKYIEIIVVFNGSEKPAEQVRTAQGSQATARENGKDFILPLVEEIVQENQGMIKCKADHEKHVTQISLMLPVERRKVT
jgi:nitrogen-specific signal transduction histidine kinase